MCIEKNQQILRTGSCYLPWPGHPGILSTECGFVNLDTSGQRLWYVEYGLEINPNITADGFASLPTNDNGYVTLAFDHNGGGTILLKYGATGGMQKVNKLIGDSTGEYPWDMASINDSTYLISAVTNYRPFPNYNASDLKLLKVKANGQVLKQVIFPDTGNYPWNFSNICTTSDGKYIMPASILYSGYDQGLLVLKFNQSLDLDTFYSHDTNKYDYLCNHKITFDSTIYINTSNPVPITVPFPADTATPPPVQIVNPGVFAIYPNPSSGNINILCPLANMAASVTIYDMLGRVIGQYNFMPGNLGQANINPVSLASGCYVMVLEQNGRRYVQKLVVE